LWIRQSWILILLVYARLLATNAQRLKTALVQAMQIVLISQSQIADRLEIESHHAQELLIY